MYREVCVATSTKFPAGLCALIALISSHAVVQATPFATRVLEYTPAPGQFVRNPTFANPAAALGAPVGGGLSAPDNTKCVTLGGFGGRIVLGFDSPVANLAATAHNPHGLDFSIFGNAFYLGGNIGRRWAEAGAVHVSRDENGNGLADDRWYLLAGSHTPAGASLTMSTVVWDDAVADLTYGPNVQAWVPPERTGQWQSSGVLLGALFAGPVVINPLGEQSPQEGIFGYADCTPTLILGDLDGDGVCDDESLTAEQYYTRPDDPYLAGVSAGSGGGDAMDIGWAIDPATGEPALLAEIDFVAIVSAVNRINGFFGEVSTEVSGICKVVVPSDAIICDLVSGDGNPPGDGSTDGNDFTAFLNAFGAGDALADIVGGDGNPPADGSIDGNDFTAFLNCFAAGGA